MRAARWVCAIVLGAIAACQAEATVVQPDATTAVQSGELKTAEGCAPHLLSRCVATSCGHSCSDDVRPLVPPGHVLTALTCDPPNGTPGQCGAVYTTCDPATGMDDPPAPPVTFDCASDRCPPPVQPTVCTASACNLDCDDSARSQVPSGWKVISESCGSPDANACSDTITVCDPSTGQTFPIQSAQSCPQSGCSGRPTQPLAPCSTDCGHSCAADAAAQIGPGERIVASGCVSGPTGQPTLDCLEIVETCDANGNQFDYSARYDDPCCGDPCCGDPCCGDPCCGDACCGDPCCGDECCGDPCCGDPCCGDPCCGDPCCGDPCCGDPCCGDECCSDGTGCPYGFTGPNLDRARVVGSGAVGSRGGRPAKAGPRVRWPASPLQN